MLPRSILFILAILSGAAGAWAGDRYFSPAADFMRPSTVSLMIWHHQDAGRLARGSFAAAAGLLAACAPLSALLAGRFRARGAYLEPLLTGLLVGIACSIAAAVFYRNEMSSWGLKAGELLAFTRDSQKEIALNSLTRSLLFGAAMTLVAGLARGLFSPVKGKS